MLTDFTLYRNNRVPLGKCVLGDDSRAPSMCLVCGLVVCSQSYCCQAELEGEAVGACTAHADACGARVGMFLRYGGQLYP